jgi:hypothetical protein
MIRPSATALLETVEAMLASLGSADTRTSSEKSALATARALIRHAALRIESEGQILAEDIRALRELLPSIAAYLQLLGSREPLIRGAHEARTLASRIVRTLAVPRPAGSYPTLSSLAEEAGELRGSVYESLDLLQGLREALHDEPAYVETRNRIRTYCARQIEAESALIEPAFAGSGPRR